MFHGSCSNDLKMVQDRDNHGICNSFDFINYKISIMRNVNHNQSMPLWVGCFIELFPNESYVLVSCRPSIKQTEFVKF